MAPGRRTAGSTGALDGKVRLGDQMRPDIDYERPAGGGNALFDLVGDLDGARILDVGCGLAPFRSSLEARGARWVGLELDGPACSVVGDADRLPFGGQTFDLNQYLATTKCFRRVLRTLGLERRTRPANLIEMMGEADG